MNKIRINGETHNIDVDPQTPLLWVLTEQLGITSLKYSCGIAECGVCTVQIDGKPVYSCKISIEKVSQSEITTLEGLNGKIAEIVKQSWIDEDVPQCGYCQSGQILTAVALLTSKRNPSEDEINKAMSVVLCRCGTYQTIRRALNLAIRRLNHEG